MKTSWEKPVILNLVELEKVTAWWQKRLGLNDWDVHIRIAKESEMIQSDDPKSKQVNGDFKLQLSTMKVYIRILDPADYDMVEPQDMEFALVHELLHLHFYYFSPQLETLEHNCMERTINYLTSCLLELKRNNTGGKIQWDSYKDHPSEILLALVDGQTSVSFAPEKLQ